MKGTKLIFKNIFALGSARVIEILSGMINVAIIARYLGVKVYGDYAMIMTYIGLIIPLSFAGVERIIIREIAKKKEGASKYLGAGLMIRWVLSLVVIILLAGLVVCVDLNRDMICGLFIVAFAQIIMSSALLYQAVFKAFERMEYDTLISAVFHSVSIGSICCVAYFDFGFVSLFLCLLLANIIRIGLAIAFVHRNFCVPKINSEGLSEVSLLLRSSIAVGIAVLIVYASANVNNIILKIFSSNTDISLFHVSHTILRFFAFFPVVVATALMPLLSRRASAESYSDIYAPYQFSCKMLVVVSLFFSALFFVFSEGFIGLLFKEDFYAASLSLRIMVIAILPIFLIPLFDHVLVSINLEKSLMYFSATDLLVKIAFGLLLTPLMGFVGASIAAVIGYVSHFLISFIYISKKCFAVPLMITFVRPILAGLFYVFILFAIKESGCGFFYCVLLGSVAYIVIVLLFKIFTVEEITLLKDTLTMRRAKATQPT